jgi:peptide/nickel transport system permease protein
VTIVQPGQPFQADDSDRTDYLDRVEPEAFDTTAIDPDHDIEFGGAGGGGGADGTTPAGGEVTGSGSMIRQMLRVFLQNKLAVASVIYMLIVTVGCFFGQYLYHADLNANDALTGTCFNNSAIGYSGPSLAHPFGCTSGGLDELGLIMFAGKYSLIVGYLSAAVTMTFGVAYGIISGFRGGWLDTVLMRLNDMFLSIPGLYLILLILTVVGRSTTGLILVIGGTGWFGVARLMRGEALSLRDREYAQAVRAMGGGGRRIVWKHILPNSMSTAATAGTFALGDSILALTALGFLGLGLAPPLTDWGTMIQNGSNDFGSGSWWEIWPLGIIFILFVLSTNYIGDALRDAFEVRLQER